MKISLVVPLKNEEGSIEKLFSSILNQTRPPDEVIFVDAGSTDGTKEILKRYAPDDFAVRSISIGPAYPGIARNEGVKIASHELIAFTDGGNELDKEWLKELAGTMEKDASVDVVYGSYAPKTDTLFKECLAMAVVPPPNLIGGGRMRPYFIASSLLKKSAWKKAGGFPDLRAAEDRIFMENIRKEGFVLGYSPDAVVIWDIPKDLKEAFSRFYSYSYHDLMAGRSRDWHFPVIKIYAAASLLLAMAFLASPFFIILAAALFALRVSNKILINRNEPYFKTTYFPIYLVCTGFLIFFIDMAMYAGLVKYILRSKPR